jgi:CubicO group peptidase (beta-lactamase class C family)
MVHHLLTHTSGLRDEDVEAHAQGKGEDVEMPPPDETQHPLIHRYLHLTYDAPLWKPSGTEMSYCNYGYNLLGEIVRRVSRQSLDHFSRERIFRPLGMADTHYILPESARHRIVRRAEDAAQADLLESHRVWETPWGAGGVCTTAIDMAVFGQMFLNEGAYGDARILCPASVREMTRNQIPGISAQENGEFFPEASWGLGWSTRVDKQSIGYAEPLQSQRAFSHGGAGGVFAWVDPGCQVVGMYFSVVSRGGIPTHMLSSELSTHPGMMKRSDMLINAATAAVVDL